MMSRHLKLCWIKYIVFTCALAVTLESSFAARQPKEKKYEDDHIRDSNGTVTGTLGKTYVAVYPMKLEPGQRFRTPCRTGNKCGKLLKRLVAPKVTQLENTIMGVMKDLARMPPGSRVPDKTTKTEPQRLLLDGMYRDLPCRDTIEKCVTEDRRRKKILRKLFFKKFNAMRQELIGYGGRGLWGGDANLFYKK